MNQKKNLLRYSLYIVTILLCFNCNPGSDNTTITIEIPEMASGTIVLRHILPENLHKNVALPIIKETSLENGVAKISFENISKTNPFVNVNIEVQNAELPTIAFPISVKQGEQTALSISDIDAHFSGEKRFAISCQGSQYTNDLSMLLQTAKNIFEQIQLNPSGPTYNTLVAEEINLFKEFLAKYPENEMPLFFLIPQLIADPSSDSLLIFAMDLEDASAKKDHPGFTMYDLLKEVNATSIPPSGNFSFQAEDINGKKMSEKDITYSKILLVDFWATWCRPCLNEIPMLKDIYAQYQNKGLEIITISIDQKKEDWTKFTRSNPSPWTSLHGDGRALSSQYNFQHIPFNLLVDQNGEIIASDIHGNELRNILEKHLN